MHSLKQFKLPIILACITIVVIIIIFAWNEKFDLTKTANDQKISNLFVILLSIGGTLGAIFYTIKQYDLALASILPDLFPISIVFNVEESSNHLTLMKEGEMEYVFPTEMGSKVRPKLAILNKGVGAAKKIKVKWIYKIEDVKKSLLKNTRS